MAVSSSQRHLADAAFDYASALAELNVPLIAFASSTMDNAGIVWAGRVKYTARATASLDVRYSLLQDWGHLNVLPGTAAAERVFSPLAEWTGQHTPHTPWVNGPRLPDTARCRPERGCLSACMLGCSQVQSGPDSND